MKEKLLQNKESILTGIVGVILGIVLCLIVIVVGGASSMRQNEQYLLESTVEPTSEEPTTEETTEEPTTEPPTDPPTEPLLTENEVIQLLIPSEKLFVAEYPFSDIQEYENAAKIFDIEVYKDRAILAYSGSITAGISLSEMLCEVNPETMTITVVLPEVQILSSTVDTSSFKVYELKKSGLATTGIEDYAKIVDELQEKKSTEYSENTTFLLSVTERAEQMIEQLLSTAERTKDYYIKFEV